MADGGHLVMVLGIQDEQWGSTKLGEYSIMMSGYDWYGPYWSKYVNINFGSQLWGSNGAICGQSG